MARATSLEVTCVQMPRQHTGGSGRPRSAPVLHLPQPTATAAPVHYLLATLIASWRFHTQQAVPPHYCAPQMPNVHLAPNHQHLRRASAIALLYRAPGLRTRTKRQVRLPPCTCHQPAPATLMHMPPCNCRPAPAALRLPPCTCRPAPNTLDVCTQPLASPCPPAPLAASAPHAAPGQAGWTARSPAKRRRRRPTAGNVSSARIQ